jgi:hypothetical protein
MDEINLQDDAFQISRIEEEFKQNLTSLSPAHCRPSSVDLDAEGRREVLPSGTCIIAFFGRLAPVNSVFFAVRQPSAAFLRRKLAPVSVPSKLERQKGQPAS